MITVKIYNVYHDVWDPTDPPANEVEDRIEKTMRRSVENVRIAKGYRNSPIFVDIDSNMSSLRRIKARCRSVVQRFAKEVDGVDVEKTVNDNNIRVTDKY